MTSLALGPLQAKVQVKYVKACMKLTEAFPITFVYIKHLVGFSLFIFCGDFYKTAVSGNHEVKVMKVKSQGLPK